MNDHYQTEAELTKIRKWQITSPQDGGDLVEVAFQPVSAWHSLVNQVGLVLLEHGIGR